MLKRLHVDNFRCLTNFDLTPARVAALVGPNGTGKSTVLEVLRFLHGFLVWGRTIPECIEFRSVTRWDLRPQQRFELDVDIDGSTFCYALEVKHATGKAEVVQESLRADGDLLYHQQNGEVQLFSDDETTPPRAPFPFAPVRSFLPILEPRDDNRRITAFRQWVAGIYLFSLRPYRQVIESSSTREDESLDPTGSNFVSWLRSLVQASPEVAEKLRKDLEPAIPGLTALRLLKFGPDARYLTFDCTFLGRNFPVVLDELSDGQRALLILYTILHRLGPVGSLLVFDEPENFLAQGEIQPWLAAMREAVVSAGRGTLLVISHHPEVIDYLAADQAMYFWREGDGPTRVRALEVDLNRGLTASEWIRLGAGNGE